MAAINDVVMSDERYESRPTRSRGRGALTLTNDGRTTQVSSVHRPSIPCHALDMDG